MNSRDSNREMFMALQLLYFMVLVSLSLQIQRYGFVRIFCFLFADDSYAGKPDDVADAITFG
ncbi:MAG: hypothetical protein KJ607_05400 [Bacteroidetes bacterium]|nr:hypothetical protein [Bacteroidota bacterium]